MERKHCKTEILYQYYSIFDIVIALLSYLLISVCVSDFFNIMLIVEPIYLSIFTYRVRVSNENIEIIGSGRTDAGVCTRLYDDNQRHVS